MTNSFNEKVYDAVKKIPLGKVATYKQVAMMCGSPGACRAVGNALHKNPCPNFVPCHRVVSSKGQLAKHFAFGGYEAQAVLLQSEGVEVKGDLVVNLREKTNF